MDPRQQFSITEFLAIFQGSKETRGPAGFEYQPTETSQTLKAFYHAHDSLVSTRRSEQDYRLGELLLVDKIR
jgi:hypothetical protein